MKTIKIRHVLENDMYYIQRKTWFRWKYIRYHVCNTACTCKLYMNKDKTLLLNDVIMNYFKFPKKHVKVIEYPPLIIHK